MCLKMNRVKFSPGRLTLIFIHCCLTAKIDIGKTDPRDSMIPLVNVLNKKNVYFMRTIILKCNSFVGLIRVSET